SIQAMPHSGCAAPVQCLLQSRVKRSLVAQTLKYGSWAMSGTAGGRNGAGPWADAVSRLTINKQPGIADISKRRMWLTVNYSPSFCGCASIDAAIVSDPVTSANRPCCYPGQKQSRSVCFVLALAGPSKCCRA